MTTHTWIRDKSREDAIILTALKCKHCQTTWMSASMNDSPPDDCDTIADPDGNIGIVGGCPQ